MTIYSYSQPLPSAWPGLRQQLLVLGRRPPRPRLRDSARRFWKGTLVTISGFTSPSGAEESTKAAAKYIKEHLATLVPKAPEVASGEVKLVERAG
jgi:hypothetical protein